MQCWNSLWQYLRRCSIWFWSMKLVDRDNDNDNGLLRYILIGKFNNIITLCMQQQKLEYHFEDQFVSPHNDHHESTKKADEQQQPIPILDQMQKIEERQIKPNALEYDIKLGWIPRSQITGPIPLNFENESLDHIIEEKMRQMIYLGYRPSNSFDLHREFYNEGKNYPFYQFHLCKSQFLQRFFKKYYSDYTFTTSREAQTLTPTALTFDSHFQGGNLDAVYYQKQEFRLIIRVDSNTMGHCNYFNFKVGCSKKGKYVFRVMNINKYKSLYSRGLKPYVRCVSSGGEWQQGGTGVLFTVSEIGEEYEMRWKYHSVKFEFTFPEDDCEYQFAYNIPFTFSELIKSIDEQRQSPYLYVSKLCHTLSGVEIPLLTISKSEKEEKESDEPYVIVITGRVHPSESNGSHIVNGLIKSLLKENSKEAKFLRRKVIFKVVPMINPDGVIVGNTRTSFSGKDLNRKFTRKPQFVFPQVIGLKDYVHKLKAKYKEKLLFVIDIHGHSSRKNSFFFGPQYSIIEQAYTKCRMLPKMYSNRTQAFRYYSCKFKIAGTKEKSSRGYFNAHAIRAYTHQTSIHSYYNFQTKKDMPWNRKLLEKLGSDLMLSIFDYMDAIISKKDKMEEVAPPEKRRRRVNEEQEEEEEEESDKQSSRGDDSEDSGEDVADRKLQQFYNKINQNKEYFYEELVAQNKANQQVESLKPPVSRLYREEDKPTISEIQLQFKKTQFDVEPYNRQNFTKVDWASKAKYPQKKQAVEEYGKLSNVVFGSSLTDHMSLHGQTTLFNKKKKGNFVSSRYSFKNIDTFFDQTQAKLKAPEHKVLKSLRKRESEEKQIERQLVGEVQKEKVARQRYLQLKEEIRDRETQKRQFYSLGDPGTFRSNPQQQQQQEEIRNLPVCSVDNKTLQQKEGRSSLGNVKVLKRKKSIKSIKNQILATKQMRKQIGTLGNKLPSLPSLGVLK